MRHNVAISSLSSQEQQRLKRYAEQRARLAAMAAANERQHRALVEQARAAARATARHAPEGMQQQSPVLAAPGLLGLGSADTVSAV